MKEKIVKVLAGSSGKAKRSLHMSFFDSKLQIFFWSVKGKRSISAETKLPFGPLIPKSDTCTCASDGLLHYYHAIASLVLGWLRTCVAEAY